jgi:hypothetical protein
MTTIGSLKKRLINNIIKFSEGSSLYDRGACEVLFKHGRYEIKYEKPEKETVIPFIRLNNVAFAFTETTYEKYLIQQGFVQQNGGGWQCGFVSIDDKNWVISHGISKVKTVIVGDIDKYIKYFKRI